MDNPNVTRKVKSLLDKLRIAFDKKNLQQFNELSNKVHKISDNERLTATEYAIWDELRHEVREIELQEFTNKNPK